MTTVKRLEEILVSRPPVAAVPTTVSLTHFDVYWLNLVPVRRLFYYAVPDLTTAHFTSSIIPSLTSSLSLTLQHFFPLSGLLIAFTSHQQLPYIRCTTADSVSLAVCETDFDFNHLAGDGARRIEQVQALVPKFKPYLKDDENGREERPLLAVQITVFPTSGFSIGVTYSHAAADGKALVHFIKSWASICRSGEIDPNCNPAHNRDLISDPGNKLAAVNVEINLSSANRPPPPPLQSIDTAEIFRYTFCIGSSKIKDLKTWATRKSTQDPPPLRVSTFMVTCAVVWVCLLEAQQDQTDHTDKAKADDNQGDEKVCHFMFLADMRERLNLPVNYFGNCLGPCIAAAKKSELVMGDEGGVYEAAKAIGKAIEEREKEGMKGAEGWRKRGTRILGSGQAITIAGSPKFGVYETDFGWGKPRKAEHAHIESSLSLAIAESRSEIGAVEFGLALTPLQFQRFNHAFHHRTSFINRNPYCSFCDAISTSLNILDIDIENIRSVSQHYDHSPNTTPAAVPKTN